MKNFNIPDHQLTEPLREAILRGDAGCYLVYGVFVHNETLTINKLHKGTFADVGFQSKVYLVPVPEFIVEETDSNYAKYVQLHFVQEAEMKSDEEMMQDFVKAFADKLAGAEAEHADTPDV